MTKMKRFRACVLLVLAAALLCGLCGCASSGTSGGTDSTGGTSTDGTAAPQETETTLASMDGTVSDAPEVESSDLDAQIKAAFQEKYDITDRGVSTDDLTVLYVAEYDGAYAVYVNGWFEYNQAICSDTINGLEFWYATSQKMLIYQDGTLYSLTAAFDQGVLDADAVASLYEIHRQSHSSLYPELADK